MVLFGRATAWAAYLGGRLVVAEAKEKTREFRLGRRKDLALLRRQSGRPRSRDESLTLAKAEAWTSEDIVAMQDDYEVWYQKRKLLSGMTARAESMAAYLSREITRRQGGDPRQKRAGRESA